VVHLNEAAAEGVCEVAAEAVAEEGLEAEDEVQCTTEIATTQSSMTTVQDREVEEVEMTKVVRTMTTVEKATDVHDERKTDDPGGRMKVDPVEKVKGGLVAGPVTGIETLKENPQTTFRRVAAA